MKDFFEQIKKYLREVRTEVKKVTWPSRSETLKYTAIVIGISGFVAVFLGGLDFLFNTLIREFVL